MILIFSCLAIGIVTGLILPHIPDMLQARRKRKVDKRYKRLLRGIPKRVIYIKHFDELFKYRDYPLYIDGCVVGYAGRTWMHCNDQHIKIVTQYDDFMGYLTDSCVSSTKLPCGKRVYKHGIFLAARPSLMGHQVKPSVIVEVY